MTFGEHLEELRQALWKAILALVVGVLFGLLFANYVVRFVQIPLKNALEDHVRTLSRKQFHEYLLKLQKSGTPVPNDLSKAEKVFDEQGLVMDEHLVSPEEMGEILKQVDPNSGDTKPLPPKEDTQATRFEDLVPFHTYHRVEDDSRVRIIGLKMEEPFVVWVKAGLIVGATFASPLVFYFLWQFVAAGLYPHEQWYVRVFLPFSIGLFLLGAALAFFVVFKFVLAFLLSFYDWMGIDPDARISDWLSFVLILPLGFGISFQLPLVMLFLERIGMFSIRTYLANWRISVLVITALAAILAPADPYSMLLMMTPLVGLYFFGILLCKWMPRRTTPFGTALDAGPE